MAQLTRVRGVQAILKQFQKIRKQHAAAMQRGLVKAGLFLQRKSQQIVPIDTGALRNSARTFIVSGTGFKTVVRVSYGTGYAVYVHEDLEANHAPGKTAQYLLVPARLYRKEILSIIKEEMNNT